jgi:hypothetical protein
VMRAMAELAEGGLGERMRLDAGVRLLVTARRFDATALPRNTTPSPAEAVVTGVTRGWDPMATTAAEYIETLPVRELDAFLAAGPIWAAEQVGPSSGGEMVTRRAA